MTDYLLPKQSDNNIEWNSYNQNEEDYFGNEHFSTDHECMTELGGSKNLSSHTSDVTSYRAAFDDIENLSAPGDDYSPS